MLQESTGSGPRIDPKAALARALAKPRWKPRTTGFGPSLTSALKQTAGALISPIATVADVAASPIERVTGTTLFRPEDIGSFNLLQSGGRATQHASGDLKELGRSVITGQDTLSQSPTARAYQQAGGGLAGAMAASSPYLELAGYAAPIAAGAGRSLGLLAPKPTSYAPITGASLDEARAVFGTPTTVSTNPRRTLAENMAAIETMTSDELKDFATLVNYQLRLKGNANKTLLDIWGDDSLVNPRLRGDYLGNELDAQIARDRQFFDRVPPLPRPVKVFRGLQVESPDAGTSAFSDFVRSWQVGDVINEPGFMSTTIDRDLAEGFANGGRVLEIDIPAGTRLAIPEMFKQRVLGENEITLPPDTKLLIRSISDGVIKATVVPSDTPATNVQTTRDQLLRFM